MHGEYHCNRYQWFDFYNYRIFALRAVLLMLQSSVKGSATGTEGITSDFFPTDLAYIPHASTYNYTIQKPFNV